MSYEYLEGVVLADVAFAAYGRDLAELFAAAARATAGAMVGNLEAVIPREERRFELEAQALDLLLVAWLDELLYYKDAEGLILSRFEVRVEPGDPWRLAGTARGEPLDPARHELLADVKAVTMHHLAVEETGEGWRATVVLDV